MSTAPARVVLGTEHAPVPFEMPGGACDCHVHVFGPATRFPYSLSRAYTPPDASIDELAELERLLGIARIVIVHPSPYGTDNSCSLDAVRRLGARARMVAVIEPGISDEDLSEMHDAGVRGVRLNLETGGVRDPAIARALLMEAAERVAPLGWHVQTFTNLTVLAALSDAIKSLPVPLVVDHIGHCRAELGLSQPGLSVLLDLVERRHVFVKLSGLYRVSDAAGYTDVDPIAKALIAAGPDRCVWGSDWPHVGGKRDPKAKERIQPFLPIDNGVQLAALLRWAPEAETRRLILSDTPARLYDFPFF